MNKLYFASPVRSRSYLSHPSSAGKVKLTLPPCPAIIVLMINPFLWLILTLIDLYSMAVIVWVVLNLLIQFNVVNAYQPLVRKCNEVLARLIEPVLVRIRRYLPAMGGVDLSPLVLLIGLNFLSYALRYYF